MNNINIIIEKEENLFKKLERFLEDKHGKEEGDNCKGNQ